MILKLIKTVFLLLTIISVISSCDLQEEEGDIPIDIKSVEVKLLIKEAKQFYDLELKGKKSNMKESDELFQIRKSLKKTLKWKKAKTKVKLDGDTALLVPIEYNETYYMGNAQILFPMTSYAFFYDKKVSGGKKKKDVHVISAYPDSLYLNNPSSTGKVFTGMVYVEE